MKLTKHNVEEMARGHLMYELARRGYCVQITDSSSVVHAAPADEHR
jgi:hypothetical protein